MSLFPKIGSIESNNGLPSNQVHEIAQDSLNRLWFCGPAGLSRYNGKHFHLITNENGLKCQGLRTVEVNDNTVWIGTDQGIETINTDGSKTNFTFEKEWVYGLVQSIAFSDSTVWAGSAFGLLKIDVVNNKLIVTEVASVGFVRKVIALENKTVYASSANGIIKCNCDKWNYLQNNDVLKDRNILSLAIASENRLLVGTDHGLFVIDNSGNTINHILPENYSKVTAISVSGNDWWIAFGSDLFQYNDKLGAVKLINTQSFDSNITCIFIDKISNVWLGTNTSGAKKISCLRFAMSKIDAGSDGSIYSIRKSNNSDYRIGGETFFSIVSNLEDDTLSKSKLFLSVPKMTIWDSYPDPIDKSVIWIASQEGVFQAIGNEIKRFESNNSILKSPARCFDSRGNDLFIGTVSGLIKINKDKIDEVTGTDGLNLGYIYNLAIDNSDKLWIATLGRGLWHETSEGLVQFTNHLLLKQANTYSVVPHSCGKVLVLQDNRIVLIEKNGETRLVLNEYPVAGWCAAWLDENKILIGSNNGLLLVDIELNSITSRINPLLGKSGWQFTNSRALLVESDEKIICGLNSGLYLLNIRKILSISDYPEINIDNIVWENAKPVEKEGTYKINSGKWTVKLSVFSSWYYDEELVKYRFKLIGFDNDWSELQDILEIKYNSLPPGKYELKAQIFTPLTGFGPPKNLIQIHVTLPAWGNLLSSILEKIYFIRDYFVTSKKRNEYLLERNVDLENEILNRKKTEIILKLNNEELQIAKRKAEESDRLKSSFLANMSHEIRTPLNSIIGFSEILDDPSYDIEQKKVFTKTIIESGKSLMNIVVDILDFSMLETKQIKIRKEPFLIINLLSDLENEFKYDALKKGIELSILKGEENNTILIKSDYYRVKQVFGNLISNALKFTSQGSISIGYALKNKEIEFFVKDTGIGISTNNFELIFDRFRKVEEEKTSQFRGNGLGLAISKNLVELLEGKIWVESEEGAGSAFFFTLPHNSDESN